MATTPHVVGYQCAGTIREVGEGVADRFVGQRVVATMLWGSHAELVGHAAIITWPIPDGADIVAAACVPVAFGTADDCLFEFGHLARGRDRAHPGRRGRRRRRGDPAREARRRDGDRDRVERRPARTRSSRSASTTASTTRIPTGSTTCARSPAGAASISSSTRSAARCSQGSVACLAYRGRAITVGSAGPRPAAVRRVGARRWPTSRSPACSSARRSRTERAQR